MVTYMDGRPFEQPQMHIFNQVRDRGVKNDLPLASNIWTRLF